MMNSQSSGRPGTSYRHQVAGNVGGGWFPKSQDAPVGVNKHRFPYRKSDAAEAAF
jgi:hypothetical protein